MTTARHLSGRVLDPNGRPVARVQVGLNTESRVLLHNGVLELTTCPGYTTDVLEPQRERIVRTDADGRFQFEGPVSDPFYLLVAHEAGFALVVGNELPRNGEIRLQAWGRVEGQLAPGREGLDHRLWMRRLPKPLSGWQRHAFYYDVPHDAEGRFVFEKVPGGWFEVGYLVATSDQTAGFTSRTPVRVRAGETTHVKVGGDGRPVIGRFATPPSYGQAVDFGLGFSALRSQERIEGPQQTWRGWAKQYRRDDPYFQREDFYEPRAPDYGVEMDTISGLKGPFVPEVPYWYWYPLDPSQRGEPEHLYSKADWSDVNWRSYAFPINADGSFRIEDVRPGTYQLAVDLDQPGSGSDQGVAPYRSTITVPAPAPSQPDQPYDLGTLWLDVHHVGEMASQFEAVTADGKPIRLIDYRGRIVLLNFRDLTQAVSPVRRIVNNVDRLQELHQTYGSTGKFQIISFAFEPMETIRAFMQEHKVEWPIVSYATEPGRGIADRFGVGGYTDNILVSPEGRIVFAGPWGKTLTDTIRTMLQDAPTPPPAPAR